MEAMEEGSKRASEPETSVTRRDVLGGGFAMAASLLAARHGLAATASGTATLELGTAIEAARAIRRKEVSSLELTQHLLGRIERLNPQLNAIVTLTAERALERARAADAALARGEAWGPFHGVPGTIKDTFETAGVRTTAGAPFLAKHVPEKSAVVVERLERAGLIVLGKTNVPFMASDWQSYNEIFGQSNNPWDLGRTPGGSTGGGAAAIAAGLSFLSVGSDIGGSIRIPAHFCGVYGHKPTLGVVPLRGHIPPPPGGPPPPELDLPVAGPLGRSAADLRAALEVLGGPDRDEQVAYRFELPPARGGRLRDYRLGCVLDDPLCPVLPEVKAQLETAVEALRRAGVTVEEGWPSGVIAKEQYETYSYLLNAILRPPLDAEQELAARAAAGSTDSDDPTVLVSRAWTGSYNDYLGYLTRRMGARKIWQDYFTTHDAFLMPVAFSPAIRHDHTPQLETRTIETAQGPRPYMDLLFWISFATMTGLPATSAPVGRTSAGLPVGIQILGPYLEDATPLDVAAGLADLVGGYEPPPGFGA